MLFILMMKMSPFNHERGDAVRPRVFLADDHPAVLSATAALLELQFEIVGNAKDGATLVSEVERLCPDVVVADITMPV